MDEIIKQIKDPKLLLQIERVVSFHGYLATGAFIGIRMFNIAQDVLGFQDGERIYVTCETSNCIPDAFQILAGATIGNNGMRIVDFGKMAVVVNRQVLAGVTSARGIRIYLDPDKTKKYPKLHAWYLNTEKVPHEDVIPELLKAGDGVYSHEISDIAIPVRHTKCVKMCEACGESFVSHGDAVLCGACTRDYGGNV
ncbi:MAG: formylmethanofuran dehydrogenase [Candidatus Methanogaster sp.]|uniref:Formylmethanofuran dehydrogenase n=1 Tax=Candidatus Methanogaster sp. TaxID=3386292 RepID=A0AC61KZB0_9EURY|nr:MAG: formylmethanofuran dehydrogenase [ANME-2 cluster archaeon]